MAKSSLEDARAAGIRLSELLDAVDRAVAEERWDSMPGLGQQVIDTATSLKLDSLDPNAPDAGKVGATLKALIERIAELSTRLSTERHALEHDLSENRLRSKVNSAYGSLSQRD